MKGSETKGSGRNQGRGRKGVDLWNRFFLIPTLPRDGGSSVIGSINQDSIRRHTPYWIRDLSFPSRKRGREVATLLFVHTCRSYTRVRSCVCGALLTSCARVSGDLYGQYRVGISTIGRTRVMLAVDTTWLLVSK